MSQVAPLPSMPPLASAPAPPPPRHPPRNLFSLTSFMCSSFLQDGEKFHVGKPFVEGASVEAEILEHTKGPKLVIYKYKPKKHYRRKTGHRQPETKFLVTKILN